MSFTASKDPFALFTEWYDAAQSSGIAEPHAMSLATATKNGAPSLRTVLLKARDARGFVFYTNLESRKSRELKSNPQAALLFYWMNLKRQVRITGKVESVTDAEADAYYATRPLESRIAALSSKQSEPLPSRATLMQTYEDNLKRYPGGNPPRPTFWSGWRVIPQTFEFWQEGAHRLHERVLFTRSGNDWKKELLYP